MLVDPTEFQHHTSVFVNLHVNQTKYIILKTNAKIVHHTLGQAEVKIDVSQIIAIKLRDLG